MAGEGGRDSSSIPRVHIFSGNSPTLARPPHLEILGANQILLYCHFKGSKLQSTREGGAGGGAEYKERNLKTIQATFPQLESQPIAQHLGFPIGEA